MYMNLMVLTGNMVKDPEVRYTPSGQAWTKFTIAVNDIYKDKNNTTQSKTYYFDIAAWDKLAENICNNVVKGMTISLHGKLEISFYPDKRFEVSKGKYLSRKNVQVTAHYVSWKTKPKETEHGNNAY